VVTFSVIIRSRVGVILTRMPGRTLVVDEDTGLPVTVSYRPDDDPLRFGKAVRVELRAGM